MTAMPFDQMEGWIWMDGDFHPWKDTKIHVISHGFHYGGAVFEGERAYNGKIFKLREHSQRLVDSANIIDMHMPYTTDEVVECTQATFEKSGYDYAYVRPIVWRGAEQMGISAKETKTHMAIACWEWGTYFTDEAWEKGITLKTSKWCKPDPRTAPTQSKASGLYVLGTMAKHEAESAGFHDSLMLDYRGYVAESSGANLFMVKDSKIKTPVPDCFLDGITRRTVMDLARNMGVSVEEGVIMPDELMQADEIFLTGTAAEVTAVSKIDDTVFNVGEISRSLKDAYHDLVRA
jgi:branched-chain amino acid aminotransferase